LVTEPTPQPAEENAPSDAAFAEDGAAPAPREISHNGETWRVEIAGRGVAGTGRFADPGIQLVRFTCPASLPDPVLEVVTQLCDLDLALEQEIVEMLRSARPPLEPKPAGPGASFDSPAEDDADVLPEAQE
jgi:hypothetical protein